MILDSMPDNGGQFLVYEPNRETWDWTDANRFQVRRLRVKHIINHMGYCPEEGLSQWRSRCFEVWVEPSEKHGINTSTANAYAQCMPFEVFTSLNFDGSNDPETFPEWASMLTHFDYLRRWLQGDPVIEGKQISRWLGEKLVGKWRAQQEQTEADLEARSADPAFTTKKAKDLLKQLKDSCKSAGPREMKVYGRAGTHKEGKSYRIFAEGDTVWNKAQHGYVDRVYLRWDTRYGSKTSMADIVSILTSECSHLQTMKLWNNGGDVWV